MGVLLHTTRRPRSFPLLALTLAAVAAAAAAVTAIINPTGFGAPVRNLGRRGLRGRGAARNVKRLRGRGAFRIKKENGKGVTIEDAARGGEFMVKFFLPDGDSFYCGGSLVGKNGNQVVTAAHCFEGFDVSADVVRIGGIALFDGLEAGIAKVALHPDYNPFTFANDIAVVTLRDAPPMEELRSVNVFPITLNEAVERPRRQEQVTLTGWGVSSGVSGADVSPELAVTRMKANPYDRCIKYLTRLRLDIVGLDESIMICASLRDKTSSCSGDSGGPLFREIANGGQRTGWVLYGVLSFGYNDGLGNACPVENPEWYTRVSAYTQWLQEQIGA